MTSEGIMARQAHMNTLYHTEYLALVRLAYQLVDDRETAEDIVQDVFAQIYTNNARVESGREIHYLRVAVLNRARSHLRRRIMWRKIVFQHPPPPNNLEPEDQRIITTIRGLPQRQREVVVMKYYLGYSVHEISKHLQISSGAVSASLSVALKKIEKSLI